MKIRDKIFIFFIIVFSSGYAFGWNNAHADEYTNMPTNYINVANLVYGQNNFDVYGISQSAIDNTIPHSTYINGAYHDIIHPVGILLESNNFVYIYAYSSNGNAICQFRNGSSNITYSQTGTSFQGSPSYQIEMFNIPFFNNYDDAINYSQGLSFESSNIVGGSVPVNWEVDTSQVLNLIPNAFDKSFNFSSNGDIVNRDVSFFLRWVENPSNIAQLDVDRCFKFNFSYPKKAWLEEYFTAKTGLETTSSSSLIATLTSTMYAEGMNIIKNGGNGSYDIGSITYDIDFMMEQSAYENFISISSEQNSTQTMGSFVIKELLADNTISNSSVLDGGIIDYLTSVYGSRSMALYSLPFINFNYVDCWCVNKSTGKVYNKICTYYMNQAYSNGTIFETRNFHTENDINDNDIGQPNNNGLAPGTPDITIPENDRQATYNQSIQDSYNNIINNYYYNNTYNSDLIDYLNKYKDGGQQEDIENAFGYLNSTINSLSNVPLLIGKLFNGFFPNAVILLLSAIFIIFCVFLLIRIIRHLFL